MGTICCPRCSGEAALVEETSNGRGGRRERLVGCDLCSATGEIAVTWLLGANRPALEESEWAQVVAELAARADARRAA